MNEYISNILVYTGMVFKTMKTIARIFLIVIKKTQIMMGRVKSYAYNISILVLRLMKDKTKWFIY